MDKTAPATGQPSPNASDTGAEEDALGLAATFLSAMEVGAVRMLPLDYRLLVLWARSKFARLDVPVLRTLLAEGLGPLHAVVENELYVRADATWTSSTADHRAAESAWVALHCRCRLPLNASDARAAPT